MATRRYRPRSCAACQAKGSACGDHGSFYEPLDMSRFVDRIARAMVKRAVTGGHTDVLVAVRRMIVSLEEAEVLAARALYYGTTEPVDGTERGRWDYSWSTLAQEVGITRQAAEQHYGVRTQLRRKAALSAPDHAAAS